MSRKIERISTDVAEKLTTAQVVVSLSSALRQLIDNSIDAGSTLIDIRVKNNGYESIEVQDNGCGIETHNFDALCKPHSTSKLTQYSDFDKLATLGFRGEALNALCTVSTVTIFTRAADSEIGTRLTFDHHGEIINRQSAARERGTTIIVEKLFETLPVRRKELERSAKREFVKMLLTIQSFALLCPQIKMLCSNNVSGKKVSLICTHGGNSTVGDVVSILFGTAKKSDSSLVEILQEPPNEEIMTMYSIPSADTQIFDFFKLRGYVSSCEHGSGRSTSDRQFVYINNRPVDYTRVCSVINEVYKQFNKNQYPIIVLFIDVPADKIDVNVTPDKKTVMLEKERHLLAVLRASMLRTYLGTVGSHSTVKSSVEDTRKKSYYFAEFSQSANSSMMTSSPNATFDDFEFDNPLDSSVATQDDSLMNVEDLLKQRKTKTRSPPPKRPCITFQRHQENKEPKKTLEEFSFTMERNPPSTGRFEEHRKEKANAHNTKEKGSTFGKPLDDVGEDDIEVLDEFVDTQPDSQSYSQPGSQSSDIFRPQQSIHFSMSMLRDAYRKYKKEPVDHEKEVDVLDELTAEIQKDEDAEAERQLSRSLQKHDFSEMKVIGQFNKGFIICRLRSHLFIVDQHASDEKYNFEKLQKSARVTKQPLFTPTPVNLGTVQEMTIRENLNVFQANGFDFDFRENDGCLKTFLTARPEILNQHLSNTDLEEIVAVVSEYPYQMYRPVRIRNIFASKACRKSVMIGKPLDSREMSRIIRHLAKLDQPWNCPHGRPTIRHLVSLKSLNDSGA